MINYKSIFVFVLFLATSALAEEKVEANSENSGLQIWEISNSCSLDEFSRSSLAVQQNLLKGSVKRQDVRNIYIGCSVIAGFLEGVGQHCEKDISRFLACEKEYLNKK